MLPGFGGRLISEAFLETRLAFEHEPAALERLRLDLIRWQRGCTMLGPASSLRAILHAAATPLLAILGYGAPSAIEPKDKAIVATLGGRPWPAMLVVAPWGDRLDPLWRLSVTEGIRRGTPWALLFNGARLRVVDVRRVYARRFAEFDLEVVADDPRACRALWTVAGASALGSTPSSDSVTSLAALVVSSDTHASGVCRSLRDGVLSASSDVLGALVGRLRSVDRSTLTDAFEQALTIIYRILFLFFAEARALVPVWHPIYRDSYSLESLSAAAERPQPVSGLWDALRASARLAHAGCRIGDLRVTPFNGRLFAPAQTPLAERHDLDDEAARKAVVALGSRPAAGGGGRERIAYRDLGVEQLGAVYETLLDYEPRASALAPRPRRRPTAGVTLAAGSGLRKATGTFYTPQPIAEYVVRRTLAPLVYGARPERILQLRIVDPAMGSGAFLVAACHYLAGAYEAALIAGGGCHPADIAEPERAVIRRTIAERCLYGVDLNPMAVQLARLSLWLTTLAADRPLSFLDHRLRVGDSLLGTWLSSLVRPPEPKRRRRRASGTLPLFEERSVRDALLHALPARFSLESIPNDTLEQVRDKERMLATITSPGAPLSKWRRVADVWCACWFPTPTCHVPSTLFSELSDAVLTGSGTLPSATTSRWLDAVETIARRRRFFHWELEFPEVFFDSDGLRLTAAGFDAVIGNPPWDMIRADSGPVETRATAREDVRSLMRFTRHAGIYRAQSDGHANRYQLFVERSVALTKPGGRIGLVLPSGLTTDRGSAALRKLLLTNCDIDALVGLDNRRGVFPIHRGVSFVLLTASAGPPTRTFACRLGLDDPAALDSIDDEPSAASSSFPVRLSASLLAKLSGDDLTIPSLRTPRDVAIVERAAALFPPLGSERGWSARFGRDLNATDDRQVLRSPPVGLPVAEGKQIEPFQVDLASARYAVLAEDARRLLKDARFERPRLAYRDVASAGNRLTLIAAVLPPGCVSIHTLFCLRTPLASAEQHFLCGLFNSFVVNYLVRMRVTTHVTTATVERLPIPTRDLAQSAYREIAGLARLLARKIDRTAYARLQARVAELYQLSCDEFAHVLSTFPLVADAERQAALAAFATAVRRPPA